MSKKVTIFPQYGGYKVKVNGSTVGAAPSGGMVLAKKMAVANCKNLGEKEYYILDENKNVKETVKI